MTKGDIVKDFLITQLTKQMRLIVGDNVREGELTMVKQDVALLKPADANTIAIRIASIDIAEDIV